MDIKAPRESELPSDLFMTDDDDMVEQKGKKFFPKKHRSMFKIKEVSLLLLVFFFFFFWGLSSFKIFRSLLLKNSRDQWVSKCNWKAQDLFIFHL